MSESHNVSLSPTVVERPPCEKCGREMTLVQIEPTEPSYERRTYECPNCQDSESVTVQFR